MCGSHLGVESCLINESHTTRKIMSSSFERHVQNWEELCAALKEAELRTELWEASCGHWNRSRPGTTVA